MEYRGNIGTLDEKTSNVIKNYVGNKGNRA